MIPLNDILHELFCVMKYCYKTSDSKIPVLMDTETWLGTDSDPGTKQYVRSVLWDLAKKVFKAGYLAGSKAVFEDLVHDLPKERIVEYNETDASLGAERAFVKWDKE